MFSNLQNALRLGIFCNIQRGELRLTFGSLIFNRVSKFRQLYNHFYPRLPVEHGSSFSVSTPLTERCGSVLIKHLFLLGKG